jgi:hypothetical protein
MRINGGIEVRNPPSIQTLILPFETAARWSRGHLALLSDSQFPRPTGFPFTLLPTTIDVHLRGQECTSNPVSLQSFSCYKALPSSMPDPPAPQRTAIALSRAILGVLGNPFKLPCRGQLVVEAHQGGGAAPRCRLCLIACNSRHGDEVEERHDR